MHTVYDSRQNSAGLTRHVVLLSYQRITLGLTRQFDLEQWYMHHLQLSPNPPFTVAPHHTDRRSEKSATGCCGGSYYALVKLLLALMRALFIELLRGTFLSFLSLQRVSLVSSHPA